MKTKNMRRLLNYVLAIALLSWSAPLVTGCADSEHMDEYLFEPQQDNEPQSDSDEVAKKLASTPTISDVQVHVSKEDSTMRSYYFCVEQPIDHNNPAKGTFKQRCYIQFVSYNSPVVLETDGYCMPDSIENQETADIVKFLSANYMRVEHRYFGKSLPEPFENTDFTYLYTDQAAADLHTVVTLMQKHIFPASNKWVATGTSKGGITATLYAYYSDKNGWNDIDLFMPFCAPFITGTATSCLSGEVGTYLLSTCGQGYPKGSAEAQAYQYLQAIPAAITSNKALRDACLRQFHLKKPEHYKEILSNFNGEQLEKAATVGVLHTFYENLFSHYSYIPFSSWAGFVPDPAIAIDKDADEEGIQLLTSFIFLSDKELNAIIEIEKMVNGLTRGAQNDEEILQWRKDNENMPYYLQAYRELGSYNYDYSLVDSTYLSPQFALQVNHIFSVENRFSTRYPNQWDGGKLMSDVRHWVKTVSGIPILFVYSYNDPWTGAAIDDAAADPSRKVWKVTNLIGIHTDDFLDPSQCDKQASQAIKNAIHTALGI